VVKPLTLYNVSHNNNIIAIQLLIFSHIITNKRKSTNFANRPIVTGKKVNLPSQYDPLLLGRLDTMGWLPLTNLPHKIYPRLVYLFYLHLTSAEGQVEQFSLTSYVKGEVITLNPRTFAQIIGVETVDLQCHF